MTTSYILYIVAGTGAWALLGVGMALAWSRMDRLRRAGIWVPAAPPAVTVLVPAKDEGPGVRRCLDSVLAQDYPNFAVVAIDDRSVDDTGRVVDAVAAGSGGRLVAHHVRHLPPGWLGKCHALASVAGAVETPWVLFVDSDVSLAAGALTAAVGLAHDRGYDALSLMSRLDTGWAWGRLVLPLAAATVSTTQVISLTNDDDSRVAFANGQFLLVRRTAYESVGGHAAVRGHITEDVALMRLLKAAGHKVRLFSGAHLVATPMHTTWRQLFNGWGRIYAGVADRRPWRLISAAAFVLFAGLGAYPALGWGVALFAMRGDVGWLVAAAVHVAVMTTVLSLMYAWSGNRKRLALMFPLAGPILLALYVYALRTCLTGRVAWRGTACVVQADSNPPAATAISPAPTPPAGKPAEAGAASP